MNKWARLMLSNWYLSFAILWIMVIAFQWLSFASILWFEETTTIVLKTLIAVAVINILLPFSSWWKLLLKAIALLFILFRTLSDYSIMLSDGNALEQVIYFTGMVTPYIWYAMIAWLLLELIPMLVTNKKRILVFIGLNIVALGVLDSFTPFVLWQEVAWIFFAGMGWLVTKHFEQFRQRYPQGWRNLRRYPFKITANIAIIFSLVIVAGVNMPEVPPSLMDPYTAWRNMSGTGTAGGNGVTGSPVQQMNSESGYSRQDNRLGGGFNFDYSPVMTVITNQRSYWRGESRRVYTGLGWADNAGSRADFEDVAANQELGLGETPSIQTESVVQTVMMQNENSYPVLFGAFAINRVESVDGTTNTDWLSWKEEQGELHWNSPRRTNRYPRTYTLISQVPVIPERELRSKSFSELYGNRDLEEYLQMPGSFPDRVTELAETITESADTPYEKVGLLQQYLQQNYTYTNNPDLSRSNSEDFVEGFLFDIREGYCDYFSTSIVMMSRSLGIPARWVKGYAPGQITFNEQAASASQEENMIAYSVTNADAHSWAEVYFGEEYGWIPVEATPGFDMPLLTQSEDSQPVQAPELEEEEQAQEPQQETPANQNNETSIPQGIVWVAVAVLVLWAGYILWRNRIFIHFYMLHVRLGRPLNAAEKVVVETERWLRYMKRRGYGRQPGDTLREAVNRWQSESEELAVVLNKLLELFEQARYSPAKVSEDDWRLVRVYAAQLRKAGRQSGPPGSNAHQADVNG
ncbi:DUF4129 domain-containing transglutaminase family protein [Paenibacillus massiliensis]|uniref:DUF4129 domain-containing transglutaminase family protein n=1 Tax=Paenibacillus massiliensis TaxID=225917 RepID=UPI0004718523|nr:transglutaminase domain-containing protein [Paenibacillus massiliensis]